MEVQIVSEQEVHFSSNDCLSNEPSEERFQKETSIDQKIQFLITQGLPVFTFKQGKSLFSPASQNNSQLPKEEDYNDKILTYNRKAKSLEELSKKFIDYFEGRGNNLIELDKITLKLGVERRRIYDVINILESLGVVSKRGKNNYEWKGLQEALRTISQCQKQGESFKIQNAKKEKSLEYLAGGFLRLFLNWKPAISLQEAAREMMKEINEDSLRTKIRRLYDIINVFRSLGLVKKAAMGNKKSGYQWAGTEHLEMLVIKKQQFEQNTKISVLSQQEPVLRPMASQKINKSLIRGFSSPMVLPIFQKTLVQNAKILDETVLQSEPFDLFQGSQDRDGFVLEPESQFPVFCKAKSAFRLVAPQRQQ